MRDPGQLPPVGAKPLYHAKPSNSIGEQGYYAYMMFDKVVTLSVNQRVKGSHPDQMRFRDLLLRLRDAETTQDDWKILLTRQPSHVNNIQHFNIIQMKKLPTLIITHSYNLNNQLQKLMQDTQVQQLQKLALKKCVDYNQYCLSQKAPMLC